uniref:Uncharacterized protein n=1 Tax=Timema bartmani TaxID=61472 RepID=A0A7R9F373_9NEOP|nr:unnamed protein product [Timema bartmani]
MLWINVVGWTVIVMLTVYAGLLIFAQYYDCDPLKSNIGSPVPNISDRVNEVEMSGTARNDEAEIL